MSISSPNRFSSGIISLLSVGLLVSGCGAFLDSEARLKRAQEAYDQGDYRAAMIDAKTLLLDEPDNAAARLLLGRSSVRLGDGSAAKKELQRAIELGVDKTSAATDLGRALLMLREFDLVLAEITPDIAADDAMRLDISRIRGDALIGLNRPVEARELYLEVLAGRPDDLDTVLAVASSYIMEGNLMQARATLDQIIATDNTYSPVWLRSGSLWVLQGNVFQAEKDFARALEIATGRGDKRGEIRALGGLIEAQLALKKVDPASASAARLAELAPDAVATRYLRARVAFMQQDWATAQHNLSWILNNAPEFQPAQILLGAVHLNRGNLAQAEMLLSAAVAAVPANLDARKLLAETRLQQRKIAEAAEVLQPALDAGATDSSVLAMAARASLASGNTDDATAYLEERVANDPDNERLKLDLAAAKVAAGEIEQAVAILQAIAGQSEEDVYRRDVLLVLTEVKSGNFESALTASEQLLERWPDNTRVYSLIGGVHLLSGNTGAARDSFAQVERLDPASLVGTVSLARIDLMEGNLDAAITRFESALERHPEQTGLMISLARMEARNNNRQAAEEWLKKAISTDASKPQARLMLGELYVTGRDYEAAEAVVSAAIDRFGDVADLHNLLGLSQLGLDRGRAAVEAFEEAIERNPENPMYRMNLARAYISLGEKKRAADTLERSLRRDPGHISTNAMLARLMAEDGDIAGALSLTEELRDRNPDNAEALALLAEMYFRGGRNGDGDRLIDEALRIENSRALAVRAYRLRSSAGAEDAARSLVDYLAETPGDNGVRMLLAQDYQSRGNFDSAANVYEDLVARAEPNYIALNNLAWVYFETGDPRAEELARQAYRLAPEVDAVVDTLGWILVQKGSVEEGIETLQIAVERSNGNAEYVYHLAEALAMAGKPEEARALLETILSENQPFASRDAAENLFGRL